MKHLFFVITLSGLLFSCRTESNSKATVPAPLIDGKYDDYLALGVEPKAIYEGVDLYIYQNEHYVWIAYSMPEGSYGTLDMHIKTDEVGDYLNLHVSGQVGEWYLNDSTSSPDSPESDKWWNMKGWNSNVVWPNGMDRNGDDFRYRFKLANARELQLSKARFGRGNWKINMSIGSIKTKDGSYTRFVYPSEKGFFTLRVD